METTSAKMERLKEAINTIQAAAYEAAFITESNERELKLSKGLRQRLLVLLQTSTNIAEQFILEQDPFRDED